MDQSSKNATAFITSVAITLGAIFKIKNSRLKKKIKAQNGILELLELARNAKTEEECDANIVKALAAWDVYDSKTFRKFRKAYLK
jgi:hypothetical protein